MYMATRILGPIALWIIAFKIIEQDYRITGFTTIWVGLPKEIKYMAMAQTSLKLDEWTQHFLKLKSTLWQDRSQDKWLISSKTA